MNVKPAADLSLFKRFTQQFSNAEVSNIHKIGRNYFLVTDDVWELREKITRDPFAMSIYLGQEKNHFIPSPAAVDMVSRLEGSDRKKIFINKKAEWLFLCGRNVLQDSILKNPNNVKEGLVLVQNETGENLGYGIFQQQGKDLVIKNLLDKGQYLRVEEKKKKKE